MTDDLNELSAFWLTYKDAERIATGKRRDIEDRMKSLIGIPENFDGTETAQPDGFTIKISGRIDRKVDSEKLQELAIESGLTDHLQHLFRWVPEVNLSAWKSADESITKLLASAITVKPNRSSFKITIKE